ncbi:helix-turn-helix domain-containing protein [Chryseobacterium ginsenosidimutans]|uniref:helix-turn-helix domain-containing protein n=1 Tax=Chryseobacterium ginsenosidimutans TaxID=687846 RepID=UPI0031DA519C
MATRLKDKPLLWKVYLDEMERKTPTDSLKAETYYNLAWDLYRQQDFGIDLSIKMLNHALASAKKANSKPVTLYCLESLSTFYALKNDNNKALKCLQEIKDIGSTVSENSPLFVTFQASTARVYSIIGDFERSISIVKKSNSDIDKYILNHPELPKDSVAGLIYEKKGNDIHLAQSYNFQKKLDSAFFYLQKAKQLEKQGYKLYNNNIWVQEAFYLILSKKYDQAIVIVKQADKNGYIDTKNKRYRALYYLAISSYYKKNYTKSLSFCEQALAIDVKIPSFMNFELEVYNLAILNAEKLHDITKQTYYSKKYNEASQKLNYAEKSRFIAKLYDQDVVIAKKQLQSEKAGKKYFYFGLILLSLICGYLCWHYIKLKRDRKKFKEIIASFENNELEKKLQEINKNPKNTHITPLQNIDRKSVKISSEVDEKIVKQLNSFEKKERFLSPNISLSSMASDFTTNAAYLSAVIKKHRDTNFNGYINDLRIEYIIRKLKTTPEYLNYKIAYLAEECGFSSHTVFIRIFTEKTGLTPSKFINFLKAEKPES